MFKKILVPIDGSEASWYALEQARQLGEAFGSTLVVMHVIQPHYTIPSVNINGEPPFLSVTVEDVETSGHTLLSMAETKLQDYPFVVLTALEFGHPAERILSFSREDASIDLILMGSRGLSSIAEFFLGSVSDTVVHHATLPVMIIKQPAALE